MYQEGRMNNRNSRALISAARLVGWHPAKQKVASFIPVQGTYLGCRFATQLGHVPEATDQCFSPSLSPSLPLSERKKKRKGREREKKEIPEILLYS